MASVTGVILSSKKIGVRSIIMKPNNGGTYEIDSLQFVDMFIEQDFPLIFILHRAPYGMLGEEFVNGAECGVVMHVGVPSEKTFE